MRSVPRRFSALVAGLAVLCSFSATCAGEADRDGTGEFFFIVQYALGDEQTTFFRTSGESATLEYDDGFKLGPGLGYNFSDHLNLNLSILVGRAKIEEDDGLGFGSSTETDPLIMPELNLDWNILDDTFTPFLTGGVGALWYPGTFGGTMEFGYGAGAGVRWDFADDAFIKFWYRARWLDLDEVDDTMLLHSFNVSIGVMR